MTDALKDDIWRGRVTLAARSANFRLRSVPSSRGNNIRGLGSWLHFDGVPIAHRFSAVEDRALLGHWVGALMAGRGNTPITTLVERRSRFRMLVKVDGKDP